MLQGIYKHTPVEYQSNLSITYREAFIYKFRSHNDLYTEIDIYTPVYIKHAKCVRGPAHWAKLPQKSSRPSCLSCPLAFGLE